MYEAKGNAMTGLPRPAGATLGTFKGPYYPLAMQQLADALAVANPQDSTDLGMPGWCERAGTTYRGYWGVDLGDGYRPWFAIEMSFGDVKVWLVLPHIVDMGNGTVSCERLPSLHVYDGDLAPEILEQLGADLAAAFRPRQAGEPG